LRGTVRYPGYAS